MDNEVTHLDEENIVIITEENERAEEKKHEECKLLMEKQNLGMEDDITRSERQVFGGDVGHVDTGVREGGLSFPEIMEVVKQSESSSGDSEKPLISEITTKCTEIKAVASEVKEDSLTDITEEMLNSLQNENILISKQTGVDYERGMMEAMGVLESLEGAPVNDENSVENAVPPERDDRTASGDIEMDCSGGNMTSRNVALREKGYVGTLVAHELKDKSQTNVSIKSVNKGMIELKDDVAATVTTDSSVSKVEIKINTEPSEEGLSSLSKALSEVETGADGVMVTGMGSLVEYSSSEGEDSVDSSASSSSTSTSSSSSDSESDSDDNTLSGRKVEGETVDRKEEKMEEEKDEDEDKETNKDNNEEEETKTGPPPPLKTKKEVMLQDLPEVPYVDFRLADGEEISLLGQVSSIIGQLVVVASNRGTPALNEDTVLFKEDRHPIGVVSELFGPVSNPFYTVRFNSTKDISDLELTLNADIFFAPRQEEITNYVFVKQLRAIKGSDASWINDEEPPPECLDYSDDEAEKVAKRKKVLEDGKRKPARKRDDSSCQDNTACQEITGQQTSINTSNSHYQYSSRGGYSRGPYQNNMQQPRTPFNTRTSHAPRQRPPLYGHNARRQHGDNNWSQQQGHIFSPGVPFDGQNIQPFDPNFGNNPDFPQRVPPPPFQNQGLLSGDGPTPWQPRLPQHYTGMPHPPVPPAMSPYSVPPPPLMSLGPLNSMSAPFGVVPPPPPPGPPP